MRQQIKNYFHLFEAVVANICFGFPSRSLKIIGVTGTDGKTTTTHLIHHILTQAGKKATMISSISAPGLHTTTPRAWETQKFLKAAVDQGIEYVVLETTSHALDQNRVWGIKYEVGIVTNITREHLDYHRTYNEYVSAKVKLLQVSHHKIINRDDDSYSSIKKLMEGRELIKYCLSGDGDYIWKSSLSSQITGQYNKQNILAAFAACRELGLEERLIVSAINNFKLPQGRMDVVYDKDFKVIIDFAHTPNAIFNVLAAVKHEYEPKGRIIHVFGSAGLRDFKKRQAMGLASGRFADLVILTEEDYRTEDVDKICVEIGSGLELRGFLKDNVNDFSNQPNKTYCIVHNREDAISLAIKTAKKDDVVITTGKSHEKSLARGEKEYPWDEFNAVEQALHKLHSNSIDHDDLR
ncbi:hypothetical protein A3C23_02830 [Candidatus Roizmanbacteria bacterium RIFCSPHIGHO2_02_FULL_37_13b]|uniref:UDP-N-acetylmuramoyl-L-alanyl-D-glutamate--2, 6-diaminopimelate ligase n=1 Tax=Candidatus Roizmanbacteria bacterium RIFCSPLOWO2_02_FULL_36_11 TaxID=1802071 RepID=A0A1F7JG70_9BACT|nr:MAG: hypothetical protein A3C23_02830 [Candidatus Roizmanbacteria bacterium RIFCSPHIGHO2_02_FULL_37_13b]OGK54608.1 MAG: hypothetical protein A3H78_01850 [Candidatus Roizmanbacteria bacterium RIFCSPLOWO2_02_FULL_36_11]